MKKVFLPFLGFLMVAAFGGGAFDFGSVAAQEKKPTKTIVKPTTTVSPTPKPTVSPTPAPITIQTVADLQTKIRNVLARPELRRGSVGVKIVSLDTNKTIFEENAEKYFIPASNMKSYTVAAALEKLSPDFRFATSVFAAAAPDQNGTIRGDLTVYGRGDVSFSPVFYDGDLYKGLDLLAEKIRLAGVKRIEGNLIGDESYFTGNAFPFGWEWDDLQWRSGAEASALAINDNVVSLAIKPTQPNQPCNVQIQPANTIIKIVNRCTTAVEKRNDLQIVKKLDQNILEISGSMFTDDKQGFENYVAVSRPAQIFVEILRGLLAKKGIIVTGKNLVVNQAEKEILKTVSPSAPVEIARLESPTFGIVAAKTMKPSQNAYTETILWTLGERIGRPQELTSALDEFSVRRLQKTSSHELGVKTVRRFLQEIGIAPDAVIQWDGSGLSRHNLITPASAVQLYTYMSKSRYAAVWRDSLTVGAIDGTLANRFKNTVAADNARGKTGTLDQVSTLSGYVTTAAGERMVFSVLINGVTNTRARQAAIDEIVVALAQFNGKS